MLLNLLLYNFAKQTSMMAISLLCIGFSPCLFISLSGCFNSETIEARLMKTAAPTMHHRMNFCNIIKSSCRYFKASKKKSDKSYMLFGSSKEKVCTTG